MNSTKRFVLLSSMLVILAVSLNQTDAEEYKFKKPVLLTAAGEVIDTGESIAHSGPAFADLNDDGLTDLLVGNYRGNIEYFENKGSNNKPEYAAGKLLEAEGEPIKVHNW